MVGTGAGSVGGGGVVGTGGGGWRAVRGRGGGGARGRRAATAVGRACEGDGHRLPRRDHHGGGGDGQRLKLGDNDGVLPVEGGLGRLLVAQEPGEAGGRRVVAGHRGPVGDLP